MVPTSPFSIASFDGRVNVQDVPFFGFANPKIGYKDTVGSVSNIRFTT
jgi:hypothetical protein